MKWGRTKRGRSPGLRVLDLSTEIAGPYATKLLVDAGADVVKLEPPQGDPLRRWTASGHQPAPGEDGVLFQYLNASKRSAIADLATEDGRSLLFDLAATADLVVESGAPGELAGLGITLDALQARNPALSLLSITPWGTEGPDADRPATEFTHQAAIGSIGYRGLPGRNPVCAGGRVGEWAAGSFAAVGATSAWLSARRTGRGQAVDLSIFEAMLLCLTIYHDLNGQWVEGRLPRGVEMPSIERAKDGWVGFCTITGQQWVDFCSLIGRTDIGGDERYLIGRNRRRRPRDDQAGHRGLDGGAHHRRDHRARHAHASSGGAGRDRRDRAPDGSSDRAGLLPRERRRFRAAAHPVSAREGHAAAARHGARARRARLGGASRARDGGSAARAPRLHGRTTTRRFHSRG